MTEQILIEHVSWNVELDTLREIRGKVFIEEQNVPQDIEWDSHDATADHFLVTRNGAALACGRLLVDGKIGRMAVLPEFRGHGIGRQLLDFIIAHASRNGRPRLYLHAQSHAAKFYQAGGFEAYGETFEEAGITHLAMQLDINYQDADFFITGVRYPEPFATLALALMSSARRHLRVYSYTLDSDVFDDENFVSAISALARRGRQSEIRILISDAKPMVSRGHRLLALARRLSSKVSIRVLTEHPSLPDATYVVRDNDGVIYKPDERARPGFYEPNSRASSKRFVEEFDLLWHWGEDDPRLKLLRL